METSEETPSDHMIQIYLENVPQYLTDFRQAITEGEQQTIIFHCHKMASAMKIMQFDYIAQLLESIEREQPKGQPLIDLARKAEKLIVDTLLLLKKQQV